MIRKAKAAAHAGCSTMALAFQLQSAGYTPGQVLRSAATASNSSSACARTAERRPREFAAEVSKFLPAVSRLSEAVRPCR